MPTKPFAELTTTEREQYFIDQSGLVGKTIKSVKYMTQREATQRGWSGRCVVLTLNDGTKVYPQMDDEGNGPGCLIVGNEGCPVF